MKNHQTDEEISTNVVKKKPEDFECDGAPRERSIQPNRRPKGSFKKLNSERRLHGEGYIKFNTCNLVPPKTVGKRCSGNCEKLGKKCNSFSDEDRERIFRGFCNRPSLHLQREFICRHVETNPKAETTVGEESRRCVTNKFFLTIRKQRLQVCQTFFLETLAISEKTYRTALEKIDDVGMLELDKRGGRVQSLQDRDKIKRQLVESHIDRYPRIESHYCRQNSDKEYLSSDLTLKTMYRMFMDEQRSGPSPMSVSYTFYSKVFDGKNLSFHHPKKDQCSLCNTFRTGDEAAKIRVHDKYYAHLKEKNKIREIKKQCKIESLNSPLVASPVFDLEEILSFPRSLESLVYYKRRLAVFNFTIYELASRDCNCYYWNETISRRGSSEIASCVFIYLEDLDSKGYIKVNLFADGCPGQNKNTIIAAMLLYFVRNSKNVNEVSLRFFETNHGQNEGDSAHSAISTAMQAEGEVLVPSKLPAIIAKARHENPYNVRSMDGKDFRDFKSYSQSLNILSVRKNDDGTGSINWTEVMELRIIKSAPNTIFYKNSHCWTEYKSITLKKKDVGFVPELNTERLKLSAAKYEDLISLCTGDVRVIRKSDDMEFYKNLPHEPIAKKTKKPKKN